MEQGVKMTNLLIGVCLLIFAVEGILIGLEYFKMQKNTKLQSALDKANQEKNLLGERLVATQKELADARNEVQGIYVLWNRALESEKNMRHELHVAKTQLTYLAQKVVRGESTPAAKKETPSQPAYWEVPAAREPASQYVERQSYQTNVDFL